MGETESTQQPDEAAQGEIAAAFWRLADLRRDAELARARLEALTFRVMARLRLSPDEYDARLIEGRLTFEKKSEAGKG